MWYTLHIHDLAQKLEDTKINKYPYYVVPKTYRERVQRKRSVNSQKVEDPILKELLAGNTVIVDCHVPIGVKNNHLKNYYFALLNRGFKLRAFLFDDLDLEVFRGMLLWAEPFTQLWKCKKCEQLQYSSPDTKPPIIGCQETKNHMWQVFKATETSSRVIKFDEAA